MLINLHIKNFTVIDALDLCFDSATTVLSGETGAGKSVIIDALALVLGERADVNLIRPHAPRCDITASFDITKLPHVKQWLIEHALDTEGDCILRRTIYQTGRSQAFINGQACPLQLLRQLSNFLITIHGQHENQALLKTEFQRQLLDDYAAHQPLVLSVRETFLTWQSKQKQLHDLQKISEGGLTKQEFVAYQLQEIITLNLLPNEINSLFEEQKQLSHAESIIHTHQQILNLMTENNKYSIANSLQQTIHLLQNISELAPNLQTAIELLTSASIQVSEAQHEITHALNPITLNPQRLTLLEERLTKIHDLARKHHIKPEELLSLQHRLQTELTELQSSEQRISQLKHELLILEQNYQQVAQQLTQRRTQAANTLEKKINEKIRTLGIPQGQLSINLIALTDKTLSLHGNERVEFLFCANPGQTLQPLNKVASGGELSRISLAIDVITAEAHAIPTIIFDEIDTGIGGTVAITIGQLLRQLGQYAQVFCITHLPQIAALAHHHYGVSKDYADNQTQVSVYPLDGDHRIHEIARMLGGASLAQTVAYAEELLQSSTSQLLQIP